MVREPYSLCSESSTTTAAGGAHAFFSTSFFTCFFETMPPLACMLPHLSRRRANRLATVVYRKTSVRTKEGVPRVSKR